MKVYVRVGRLPNGKRSVSAKLKQDHRPLENSAGAIPTVAFAIEVDVPEAAFAASARVLGRITVDEDAFVPRDVVVESTP